MLHKMCIGLAKRLMQPINPSLVALLGIYTLVWGFWLANPFWEVFSQAALYDKMSEFPESAWGVIAIFSGLEILRGVFRGRNKDLRRGALVGYLHWLVITIMYFCGDWRNTGGITSLTISVYCFVVYLNYRRNRDYPQNSES